MGPGMGSRRIESSDSSVIFMRSRRGAKPGPCLRSLHDATIRSSSLKKIKRSNRQPIIRGAECTHRGRAVGFTSHHNQLPMEALMNKAIKTVLTLTAMLAAGCSEGTVTPRSQSSEATIAGGGSSAALTSEIGRAHV